MVPRVVPRPISRADPGAHQRADDEVLRAADRLRAAQHVRTARPGALQLSVEPRKGAVQECSVEPEPCLSSPALLRRPRRHRRPGPRAPDPARAEARHRVSVADVRAEDSLSVGPAAADPSLVPAADARRGDRADRRRLRAAVFPAAAPRRHCRRRRQPRGGDPARSVREHGLRRPLAARPGRGAARSIGSLGAGDQATLVLFSRNAEESIRATSDRGRLEAALGAAKLTSGATRYGPALKLAESILARSTLQRQAKRCSSPTFRSRAGPAPRTCTSPTGMTLTPVSVGDREIDQHRGALGRPSRAPTFSSQERITVTAGVANKSGEPATNVPVSLEIDGHAIETLAGERRRRTPRRR